MFNRERTPIFWIGLVLVALASTIVFSILWNSIFIYPPLTDPEFLLKGALETGMSPRSIIDGPDGGLFQAYPWLGVGGRSYSQFDYWKLFVPPIVGASTFILIGLYMMKSGTKRK